MNHDKFRKALVELFSTLHIETKTANDGHVKPNPFGWN